jgi:glycine oxidase
LNVHYDAIIIGAGVIGCSIAYQLAKRNKKVLIVERSKIGNKASTAAAGMLGVHTELGEDAGLLQACLKSRDMFPALSDEVKEITGIDFELSQNGMIKLAFSESDVLASQRLLSLSKDVEWLTEREVSLLEPSVSRNIGGLYAYKDGNVHAGKFTLALAKSAIRLGSELKEYTPLLSFILEHGVCKGIRTHEGTYYANEVIVAGGAWSGQILKHAGFSTADYPVKGECFSVMLERPIINRTIFTNGCYLVPKRGDRLLVGATEHPHTFDESTSVEGINILLNKAIKILPDLANGRWEKAWTGVRPRTAGGLPHIGRVKGCSGLSIATGHYRNGILLAPLTGVLMADVLEGKEIEPMFEPGEMDERMMIREGKD